jgi:hypothetical protein
MAALTVEAAAEAAIALLREEGRAAA